MTYCPNGVNQPRTQKKRIAWEMEKSWVKKTRKAVFLDDLPEKHQTGPEIITKNPIQAGASLLKTVVSSSGNNLLLKTSNLHFQTSQESKGNIRLIDMQTLPPKKRGRPLGSTNYANNLNRNSGTMNFSRNQGKDARFARFKKNLKNTNNLTKLKFTHNYSGKSSEKSSSSSTSHSSDSTDSNQPIPIHFKCKDIEFTKITFSDELEKEKKKMEKVKKRLEQEKAKMKQIREEQIKSLQETSNNNSLQSEDGSKSIHGSSHENLEANEDTEIDNIPRLIQRISYQGYMLEYLDLMEKRMVDLSQSSSTISQGLDELWFGKEFYYHPMKPKIQQNTKPSNLKFPCRISFKSLSPDLIRDLIAKSRSKGQY